MTIKTMLASDALDPLDLNCAEKILYAANEAYGLGLDPRALRLAAGFGGGLGCGLTCGALSGGAMALSCLFVRQRAHESGRIKALCGELAARLRGMLCHVNLIPANPVDGSGCVGGSRSVVERFQHILEQRGINATIRRTLGSDINASCGQLRRDSSQ